MKMKTMGMLLVLVCTFTLAACGRQENDVPLSEKESNVSTIQPEEMTSQKEDGNVEQTKNQQAVMGTGKVECSDFSGKVTGCYYADEENIIVAADRLYLYDTQAGKVLADVDICLQDLKVQTFSDGYFVVGEGSGTASGSFMAVNNSGITAYLLDQDFHIKDTISMSGLVDSDFVISTTGVSISEDGSRIAFCGTQGLYLYDVSGKNVSTILKYSENAIANNTQIVMIDSIVFTHSNTLAYTGNGIDIGSTGNGFSIYGMVSADNAALSITKKASYEVAELQIGGSMLVMPQSFNKNNGTLLLFDTITSTEQTINFETGSEGKDGIFCSQNGNYVATASLGDTSVTITIYDMVSGNVIHTEKISDSNSTYFLRIPQILLLDDSKTCIAILGRGISEVDTLISSFGFEG